METFNTENWFLVYGLLNVSFCYTRHCSTEMPNGRTMSSLLDEKDVHLKDHPFTY